MKTCTVDGCADVAQAKGMCWSHYHRWRRHGDPLASGAGRVRVPFEGTVKRCSRCGKTKALDEFTVDPRYNSGRASRCIPCGREYRLRTSPEGARRSIVLGDGGEDAMSPEEISLRRIVARLDGLGLPVTRDLVYELGRYVRHWPDAAP